MNLTDSVDEFLQTRPNLSLARRVALFGSRRTGLDPKVYAEAEALGKGLAEAGWVVLSGGYGGVMEAVSRGAFEAGGTVYAITAEYNQDDQPNPYYTYEVRHADLLQRMRYFVETADAFLALPGGLGTFSELALTWNHLRTQGWGHDAPPLILWQDPWRAILEPLDTSKHFLQSDHALLTWVQSARDALGVLGREGRVGQALRDYEETTGDRGKLLEGYLDSDVGRVRPTFARLEPMIWSPTDEPIPLEHGLSLVEQLLGLPKGKLASFSDLPFEDATRSHPEHWASEFEGPFHGERQAFERRRTQTLAQGTVWLQEIESQVYVDLPTPLDEGGDGDHVLRIAHLVRGWVVTLQLYGDGLAAVSTTSPRKTRELLEFCDFHLRDLFED
jgi:uncharacterized protein (TIGR00730 family)